MLGRKPEYEPTAPWNEEFMEIMKEISFSLNNISETMDLLLDERGG